MTTLKQSTQYRSLFVPKIKRRVDMNRVAAIILGGGSGTRLFPLTLTRCKPAISFGGRYRLIDIPMSNALNSGCHKIYILTQFLSASLHQHILKTYRIEPHTQGFVEILSAEQKPTKKVWYQGTADAIRQNVEYLSECDVDYFLILSGDQLYQMDYEELVVKAEESQADLVIGTVPVNEDTAKRMGILKIDHQQMIVDFIEKPQDPYSLDSFKTSYEQPFLGSMGIYLFKRKTLLKLLEEDIREDFGKHLIPTHIQKKTSLAYIFNEYWEDIGTIDSFYTANLALTTPSPSFNLYDDHYPIHTVYQSLPPPKIYDCEINYSLICEGSHIQARQIKNSIIGPRSIIGTNSSIDSAYLFGNDTYATPERVEDRTVHFTVGSNCDIRKAIIDKQVRIGNNVKLLNRAGLDFYESDILHIRNGIIIVNRGAIIPDNFVL